MPAWCVLPGRVQKCHSLIHYPDPRPDSSPVRALCQVHDSRHRHAPADEPNRGHSAYLHLSGGALADVHSLGPFYEKSVRHVPLRVTQTLRPRMTRGFPTRDTDLSVTPWKQPLLNVSTAYCGVLPLHLIRRLEEPAGSIPRLAGVSPPGPNRQISLLPYLHHALVSNSLARSIKRRFGFGRRCKTIHPY